MTTIWTSRHYKEPGNPAFCRAAVYSREHGGFSWLHSYQCTRKPTCKRVIDGEEYGFCKQHDPEEVKKRNQERRSAWEAEWREKEETAKRQKQEREAMDACKAAIVQIAAGHNDPRTLATETLKLFP